MFIIVAYYWAQKSACMQISAAANGCLDGAVRRRTRDREVAGSTPGRGAIKSTGSSTQPYASLRGR